MCFVFTCCGMITLTSCSEENEVTPNDERPIVINCVKPDYLKAGGSVQGGVLFTLADLAFAAATNSHGNLTVTSAANITFLRGANSGVVTAEAHELVNHRHLPFCEVRVTDHAGNLLAIFTASGYRKEGVTPKIIKEDKLSETL